MDTSVSFKIEVFVPASHVELLRDALAKVGAGQVGNYDHCVSITEVRGYRRPLEGAHPYEGQVGAVSSGTECKLEVRCSHDKVKAALQAIRQVHPYEEPLINVLPLANHLFEDR